MQDCERVPQYPLLPGENILDWSTVVWPPTSTSQQYTVGGVDLDFQVTQSTPGLFAPNTPVDFNLYQGDQPAIVNTLIISGVLANMGTTESISTLATFSEPVANVNFKLFDVDGETGAFFRRERYEIVGLLNGNPVSAVLSPNGDQQVTGDIVDGVSPYPADGPGSENGVVNVRFLTPIDQFRITFSIAPVPPPVINPGSTPGYGLYNIGFNRLDTSIDGYTDPSRYQFATCQNLRDYIPDLLVSEEATDFTLAINNGGSPALTTISNLADQLNLQPALENKWIVRANQVQSTPGQAIPLAATTIPLDFYAAPISIFSPSAPIQVLNNENVMYVSPTGVQGTFIGYYSIALQKIGDGVANRVGARIEPEVVDALTYSIDSRMIIGDIDANDKSIHVISKSFTFTSSAPTRLYLTVWAETAGQWQLYNGDSAINAGNDNFPPPLLNGQGGSADLDYPCMLHISYFGPEDRVNPQV